MNYLKVYKHVINIDYQTEELANIVMECIKPDFILSGKLKDSSRHIEVIGSKLIIIVESNNIGILRKTLNVIYSALILSSRTIEIFSVS